MNPNEKMGLQNVIEHLEKNDLKYSVDRGNGLVRLSFGMTNARISCFLEVNGKDNLLQFTGLFPVQASAERRHQVCELIALINWRILFGKFQMDLSDGELRFSGSAPYPKGALAEDVIHMVIGRCVISMDDFFPAIAAVIFAGTSPEAALAAVLKHQEAQSEDEGEAVPAMSRIEFN